MAALTPRGGGAHKSNKCVCVCVCVCVYFTCHEQLLVILLPCYTFMWRQDDDPLEMSGTFRILEADVDGGNFFLNEGLSKVLSIPLSQKLPFTVGHIGVTAALKGPVIIVHFETTPEHVFEFDYFLFEFKNSVYAFI